MEIPSPNALLKQDGLQLAEASFRDFEGFHLFFHEVHRIIDGLYRFLDYCFDVCTVFMDVPKILSSVQ